MLKPPRFSQPPKILNRQDGIFGNENGKNVVENGMKNKKQDTYWNFVGNARAQEYSSNLRDNNGGVFKSHDGYVIGYLGKAIYKRYPFSVLLLEVKTLCVSSSGISQAGIIAIVF